MHALYSLLDKANVTPQELYSHWRAILCFWISSHAHTTFEIPLDLKVGQPSTSTSVDVNLPSTTSMSSSLAMVRGRASTYVESFGDVVDVCDVRRGTSTYIDVTLSRHFPYVDVFCHSMLEMETRHFAYLGHDTTDQANEQETHTADNPTNWQLANERWKRRDCKDRKGAGVTVVDGAGLQRREALERAELAQRADVLRQRRVHARPLDAPRLRQRAAWGLRGLRACRSVLRNRDRARSREGKRVHPFALVALSSLALSRRKSLESGLRCAWSRKTIASVRSKHPRNHPKGHQHQPEHPEPPTVCTTTVLIVYSGV